MELKKVLAHIESQKNNEPFVSIQKIAMNTSGDEAKIKCHASSEFTILVKIQGDRVIFTNDKFGDIASNFTTFIFDLKKFIYSIDETLQELAHVKSSTHTY